MSKEPKKILAVDDLPDWRKTLKGLLQDEGYEVVVAESLETALALIEKDTFDLVVMDVRLDESNERNIDGIELAFKVQKKKPDTKIVIITGYGTMETVEKAMKEREQQGKLVVDFIPKDEIDMLIPIVNQALS